MKTTAVTVTTLDMGADAPEVGRRVSMHDSIVGANKHVSVADVARQSYAAVMAGKDLVVAGPELRKPQPAATTVAQATL